MSLTSNRTAHELRKNPDSEEYKAFRAANNAAAARWRAANPEASYEMHIRRNFGMASADYAQLLKTQQGVCAICHEAETAKTRTGAIKPLAVDHCHATGIVRGLLCHRCNQILGFAHDNTRILSTAITYLELANTGFKRPAALDEAAADAFIEELKAL